MKIALKRVNKILSKKCVIFLKISRIDPRPLLFFLNPLKQGLITTKNKIGFIRAHG